MHNINIIIIIIESTLIPPSGNYAGCVYITNIATWHFTVIVHYEHIYNGRQYEECETKLIKANETQYYGEKTVDLAAVGKLVLPVRSLEVIENGYFYYFRPERVYDYCPGGFLGPCDPKHEEFAQCTTYTFE